MREITFEQGNTKGVMRINGKLIYLKVNNKENLAQLISQYESKGAKIVYGNSWIQIDIFSQNKEVKLGNHEFNVDEKTNEEVEEIFAELYMVQFTKLNFKVSEKKIA